MNVTQLRFEKHCSVLGWHTEPPNLTALRWSMPTARAVGMCQLGRCKQSTATQGTTRSWVTTPLKGGKQGKARMWKWLGWVHFWKDVWKIQNYAVRNDWRETQQPLPNKGSAKFCHGEELKGICWAVFGGEKLTLHSTTQRGLLERAIKVSCTYP